VDAAWEKLLRLRASYVWVSEWPSIYFWQYAAMLLVASAAYWRLRRFIQPVLRFFITGLVASGVASLLLSYLLLERLKWAMAPQIQPLRTILFLEMFTVLLALVMAFELACKERRPAAAGWWVAVALAVGVDPRLVFVLAPVAIAFLSGSRWRWAGVAVAAGVAWGKPFGMALWKENYRDELFVVLLLAVGIAAAASLLVLRRAAGAAAMAAVVMAAFFLIPGKARFHWSGQPQNSQLAAVIDWARRQTDVNAVFLFADAGRGLDPGIFRARAARALYVDWKGGGQINFFHEFSRIWWARWQQTLAEPFHAERLPRFRELGIDYVVLGVNNRLADRQPVFENGKYLVYRLR